MRLPRFAYLEPNSLPEALTLLAGHERVAVKAGGTDLLPRMKSRLLLPQALINLTPLKDLDFIRLDHEGNLVIGALTPLSRIESSPILRDHFEPLAGAVAQIGSPELRNMGTLGGNICLDTRCQYYNQSPLFRKGADPCLKTGGARCYISKKANQCHALFCADAVPLLTACGAKIKIVSLVGESLVSLEDFFTGNGKHPFNLLQNELLTEVQIPKRVKEAQAFYLKFRFREAIDFPLVGIAAFGVKGERGDFEEIRIVAGGVNPAPVRCLQAEEILRSEKVTDPVLERAGEVAAKEIEMVSGSICPVSFRKTLARQLVVRAGRLLFSSPARGGL